MNSLYPLKFKTIFKDKIWGGTKIRDVLDKEFSPLPNCGETWEVSGVEGNISVVSNGALSGKNLRDLVKEYKGELVGKRVYRNSGDEFPLLIKFIDANQDLSIQVHPDDELAKKRHNSLGKTEMWYILQADEGASLISGFNKKITKETYLEKFNSGNLSDILNRESAFTGDVFFIPAGRVHTIGQGLMIAEIQQTSDITYRIYDFDRVDDEGNKRELHVEEALDAIDYNFYDEYKSTYSETPNTPVKLAESPYFYTNKLVLDDDLVRNHSNLDSFVIYICVKGEGMLSCDGQSYDIKLGECLLVPASINRIEIKPVEGLELLETFVPE